jgi:uncharacterized membrane protein
MSVGDVLQIVAFVAFWFICDWAAGESKRKRFALVFSGVCILALGTHNGFEAGKAKAIKDAQQAAILTSPEMPR